MKPLSIARVVAGTLLFGLLGLAVLPEHLMPESQAIATGGHSYNEVLPIMLARYCGPGLLGLGITALSHRRTSSSIDRGLRSGCQRAFTIRIP